MASVLRWSRVAGWMAPHVPTPRPVCLRTEVLCLSWLRRAAYHRSDLARQESVARRRTCRLVRRRQQFSRETAGTLSKWRDRSITRRSRGAVLWQTRKLPPQGLASGVTRPLHGRAKTSTAIPFKLAATVRRRRQMCTALADANHTGADACARDYMIRTHSHAPAGCQDAASEVHWRVRCAFRQGRRPPIYFRSRCREAGILPEATAFILATVLLLTKS
jgi:hypothetical protein